MKRVRDQIFCTDDIHQSLSGKNITVAILDTGISLHPDFNGRIIEFKDFIKGAKTPYDDSGHGTHVAGCLAGSGLLSNNELRGIAYGCNLVICKTLNHKGEGNVQQMKEALLWILENYKKYRIKVLNISVSFEDKENNGKLNILLELIKNITEKGIFTLVAAGNNGPSIRSISPLGIEKHVFCVGCYDLDYKNDDPGACSSYSGRGPSIYAIKKPDLVAPGTNIISTSSNIKERRGRYISIYEVRSGTSFSTPIVAGTAALILEKYPGITNEELKNRLCYSAIDLKEPWNKQGWGMLNVKRALSDSFPI